VTYWISVRCEGSGARSFCGDGWSAETPDGSIPAEFGADVAARGWAERDGKWFCPRHDPAKQGTMVKVGLNYVELAPGVRARWPGAVTEADSFPIEVQVDDP